MERAFENQKCIEVSLARFYNGSLVLKTEEKSLSKTATFLTSIIQNLTTVPTYPPPPPLFAPPNIESMLSVAQ